MLTYQELAALERTLRDERVLSVYVDGRVSDPAARDHWRRRVDDELRALRTAVGASRDERDALERAAAHLLERLPPDGGAVGAPGWVGFVTADGVAHGAALPVPMRPRAAWSVGPRVAPYLGALKQLLPVIVAVADSVRTRLYRYRGGTLETLDTVRTERHDRSPSHMGSMPRVGFHTGTRGAAGVDEAERRRLTALGHAASDVAERLVALAGADGWIVIGGTPEAARMVRRALPAALSPRVATPAALHDGASEAEVARAAEAGASALWEARTLAAVTDVLDRAGEAGRGVAGLEATRHALARRAVQTVLFTHAFLERDADAAEAVARDALAQHAAAEEVTGAAAERLDREGGGIAARLRYGLGSGPTAASPSADIT